MRSHSLGLGYLFWLVLGPFGAHRFYYDRKGTGALYLCTLGLAGIGWMVDLLLVPKMNRDVRQRYQVGWYGYGASWLLLFFAGFLGCHRFYLGRWKSGLLYALTLGLLGLGVLHDLFVLNGMVSEKNESWIIAPRRPAALVG